MATVTAVTARIGHVGSGPITAIALGQDGSIACGSLAGLHLSRDGGRSWVNPAPGRIGPFIRDVVLSESAGPRVLYVGTVSSLARSLDGGTTWSDVRLGVQRIVPAANDKAILLLEGGVLGQALEDEAALRVDPLPVPQPVSNVAIAATSSELWTIDDGGISCSEPPWETWTRVPSPLPGDTDAFAVTPSGTILMATEGGALARLPRRGSWTEVDAPWTAQVTSVAAPLAGRTVALATEEAVYISYDDGATWDRIGSHQSVLCLAMSSEGTALAAGTADGRCLLWRELDGSPSESRPTDSALVGALLATSAGLMAVGFDGIRTSTDGTTWTDGPASTRGDRGAAPLVDTETGHVWVTLGDELRDGEGSASLPLPVHSPALVACRTWEGRLTIAASDGARVWVAAAPVARSDGPPNASAHVAGASTRWEELASLPASGAVVALDLVPAAREPRLLTVVGVRDADAVGSVHALRAGRWLELGRGLTGGAAVLLRCPRGSAGIVAAIGNAVLRPAAFADLVLTAEHPQGPDGPPIAQLAVLATPGSVHVATLTSAGVAWSADGGLTWVAVQMPPGPPPTALALLDDERPELLATLLGGEVVRCTLA